MTDLLYRSERPQDDPAIAALTDRAFGPGRYAKAAERLREGNRPLAELSRVALLDGRLLGSVRLWPVTVGGQPAAFLGPIAVEAESRNLGIGQALVEQACAAAAAAGWPHVLLVGDAPWFGRMGFIAAPSAAMPGPVDPRRVLALRLSDSAPDLFGLARIPSPAEGEDIGGADR